MMGQSTLVLEKKLIIFNNVLLSKVSNVETKVKIYENTFH